MAIKDDMEDVQEAVINELITENGITNTLADGQVTETKILNSAVTTPKIANGAVTAAKLGSDVSLTLADGDVTTAKINNGAVTTNKLAVGAVTASKIGAGEVGTLAVADDAVTPAKLSQAYLESTGGTVSGNLLVGKTTTSFSTAGSRLKPDGGGQFVVSGGTCVEMNRLSLDGTIMLFQKDGSTVGSISSSPNSFSIASNKNEMTFTVPTSSQFIGSGIGLSPFSGDDGELDIGRGNAKYDDIHAVNGTIQTSDENEKQDIEDLSEAEQRVAVACKGLLRKFRWKSAVEEKGEEARIHFGIIAQDLQAAFEAEGLDAGRYAMFISSTWWEKERVVPAVEEETDEEGNITTEAQESYTTVDTWDTEEEADEGATAKTRLGVRYSELLAFIISAI